MDRDQDIILNSIQKSLDELTEWQDNQYNPGHYIGGITPSNLLSPRKSIIVGWGLIVISLSLLALSVFVIMDFLNATTRHFSIDWALFITQVVILVGFAVALLIGGILKVRKKTTS